MIYKPREQILLLRSLSLFSNTKPTEVSHSLSLSLSLYHTLNVHTTTPTFAYTHQNRELRQSESPNKKTTNPKETHQIPKHSHRHSLSLSLSLSPHLETKTKTKTKTEHNPKQFLSSQLCRKKKSYSNFFFFKKKKKEKSFSIFIFTNPSGGYISQKPPAFSGPHPPLSLLPFEFFDYNWSHSLRVHISSHTLLSLSFCISLT